MTLADDWGLLDPLDGEVSTLTDDRAVLRALVDVEGALTGAWHDAGLAPAWVAGLELDGAELDLAAISAGTRAGGNPVIPLVSQLRKFAETQRAGAGDWVHRGATSQDIVDTALMLCAHRAARATATDLREVGSSLAALADEHRATLMVGRTLTQHAAPITFGAKVASWLEGVDAALSELDRVTFPVQLAGSVGIGSAFAALAGTPDAGEALRSALARRLGLADPGRSWQAQRSPVAQAARAFALVTGVLGRIATDVLVLVRPEIGELVEGSEGTSSAMPQKRNPITSALLRSAALQAPGLLSTVQLSSTGADERAAGEWHAEWLAFRGLARLASQSARAAVTLTRSLEVRPDRMLQNLELDGGVAWAEHAQAQLSPELGLAAASALVSRAVGAVSPHVTFGAALAAELDGRVVDLSPEAVIEACARVVDAALSSRKAIS